MRNRTVIGLTGGNCTGKSMVAAMFHKLGAEVVDADELAHGLLLKGSPAYARVRALFGAGILDVRGEIDRKKLGALIFAHPGARKKLEAVIHPRVKRLLQARVRAKKNGVIVLEVPLLMEAGFTGMADMVVVVSVPQAVQLQRLRRKTGLSRKECLVRIHAQMPLEKKVRMADFLIDNSKTRPRTWAQVKQLWEHVARRK